MNFDQRKEDLIDVIQWYMSASPNSKTYYAGVLERVNKIESEKELHEYEQVVESWLSWLVEWGV